ncbi:putative integral membrane protein [Cryptosporidium meleagridis]|uniref:Putative integral membrane protein n=1 Tax=Cryptosporidium meleagridis TaxID=93969 RepID=A0A2P4Z3H3_9CRYT|nr:putative integral membrane protein [Cryptosporidium meleagridis]
MKVNRLFSPIGIFIAILFINTFSQSGYIRLVDAAAAVGGKQNLGLFDVLSRLVTLKNYMKRLHRNKSKQPGNKEIDTEIERVDSEIKEIEEEAGKDFGGSKAGEVLNNAELRLSGMDPEEEFSESTTTPKGPTVPVPAPGPVSSTKVVVPQPVTQIATSVPVPTPYPAPAPAVLVPVPGPVSAAKVVVPPPATQIATSVSVPAPGPYPAPDPVVIVPATGPVSAAKVVVPPPATQVATSVPVPVPVPHPAPAPAVPVTTQTSDIGVGDDQEGEPIVTPGSLDTPVQGPDQFPMDSFSDNWRSQFAGTKKSDFLRFGVDGSAYESDPAAKAAFSRYIQATSNGISDFGPSLRILSECKIINERNIIFLQAFIYHFSILSKIDIQPELYCLLFTNSVKPNIFSFISNLRNYLNNKYTFDEEHLAQSVKFALNYLAAKTFSRKYLTISGVKKLAKENKELALECDANNVEFATSLLLLTNIYSDNLEMNSRITLADICTILKGYQDLESRIREIVSLLYRTSSGKRSLFDLTILVKESLESAYRALSIPFSDYFLDTDKKTLQSLTPMSSDINVSEIIKPIDHDEVIRTSDRYISGKVPIPEIPGPPSRRGSGPVSDRVVPTSADEIFKPLRTSKDYQPFKRGSLLHPPTPENLPDKASGRGFVKSLEVHMKPRDYETEFLYGSSGFVSPQLTYFKRVSEREYNHDKKIKQAKEEQKRLEKKREQKMARGYRDLRDVKELDGIDESASELPDISEEPSPLPDLEEPKRIAPSKFETKLHKLVPKSSSIYTQPSQRFQSIPIGYSTLKPMKGMFDTESRLSSGLDSEIELDEASEGTIGLPTRKEDDGAEQSREGVASDEFSSALAPKLEKILTTEIAAKELLLKCPDLSRSQRKRALSLFRILKYLYKGRTNGWCITAFCRAVYFAEKDVCISRGEKSLDIKKMASECFTALSGSSFIKGNAELSNLARQVCYSYYKKRAATVCLE